MKEITGMQVKDYIRENLPRTVRHIVRDEDTLFGLPYPYTVPCADGMFNELYYWDTYFTNKALLVLGQAEQAANNTKDILYRSVRLHAQRQPHGLFAAQSAAVCRAYSQRRV